MKYTVEPCVCDYCIKKDKNEIVLILNSRANALAICAILNADENHENEMLAPICWESEKRKQIIKETEVGKVCGDYTWFKNLCKQYGEEVEE